MSGPKSYDYWVDMETEEQIKERLRRQREEEELNTAKDKFKDLLNLLHVIISQIGSIARKIDEIEIITRKKITYHDDIKHFNEEMATYVKNSKNKYWGDIDEVNKEIGYASKCYRKLVSKKMEADDILLKCTNDVSNEMDNKISDVNMRFSFLEEKKEDNPYLDLINDRMKEIDNLILSKDLRNKQNSIKQMLFNISSVDEYKSLYSIMTIPFVKECIEYDRNYNQLVLEYEVLVKELKAKKVSFEQLDDPLYVLKNEIDTLEEMILSKKKNEYICECLEEAMEEMGYSLVGARSVVKKSGKKFENKLYKFDEGTVVNVTIQDNGQISMELGGADIVDRNATKDEAIALVTNMEEFCDNNKKIQEFLESKGIKGKNISHMPPTVEHAQIININEYQLYEELSSFKATNHKKKMIQKERESLKEE